MRTNYAGRTVQIREWAVIQEMDRAKRAAEDCEHIADQLAQEVGFERVRVEHLEVGDVYYTATAAREVVSKDYRVSGDGADMWDIAFIDGTGAIVYPGEFVSRQLPDVDEPF